MPRVKFLNIKTKEFLDIIQNKTKLSFKSLAEICVVHRRSFSDWKSGKYLMPFHVFEKLIKISDLEPPIVKIIPDYWYVVKGAREGGLASYRKYGCIPGWTKEASRRGGLNSIKTHTKKRTGFFTLKAVFLPKYSSLLAEFFGILLGDGGITDGQIIIALNRKNDRKYAFFVSNLIKKLFKIKPALYKHSSKKHESVIKIVISRVKLVRFLLLRGLKKGNKVKQQVQVPLWIKNNIGFSKSCIRGLIDTDGCVYIHKHKSHGYNFLNVGIQLSNQSRPILIFAKNMLEKLNFTPKINKSGINLYREQEVYRYAKEIGFHNYHHQKRLKYFLKQKKQFGGVG